MEKKVKKFLDKVRPSLQADGGDVEFVSYDQDNGIVSVRLTGACVGCPMSAITLKAGIEEQMKAEIPEIKEVINVD